MEAAAPIQPPAAAVPVQIPPPHHHHHHAPDQGQPSTSSPPSASHSPSQQQQQLLHPSSSSPSSPPRTGSSAASGGSSLKPRSSWSHLFSKPNLPALTTRRASAASINAGEAASAPASALASSSPSFSINVDDVDLDANEHAAPRRGSGTSSMSTSIAVPQASASHSGNGSSGTPGKSTSLFNVASEPSTPSAASLLRRFSGSVLPHTAEPSPSSTTNGSTSAFSSSPGSVGRSMSAYKLMNGTAMRQGSTSSAATVSGALMQINSSLASASSAAAAASGSAASTAPTTPAAIDVPKSSILLNPIRRRSVVDTWRWDSAGLNPGLATAQGSPPLTILRVPAIPSARERREAAREAELAAEKAREREREKAREKEREAEDKLWGIPKKAFYLGLPDLNFNSQASMLAGWGNGSGTTDFRPTPRPQSAHGAHGRTHSVTSGGIGGGGESSRRDSTQRDRDRERERAEREREAERQRKKEEEERAKDAEMDEPMDPEELAALNAIINTRRSAASAMALASGAVKFGEPSNARRGSQASAADTRPGLGGNGRTASRESVPSRPSMSARRSSNDSSVLGSPDKGSARIRFAPLPQPFGPLPAHLAQVTPYPTSNPGDSATDLDASRDQAMQQLTGAGLPRTDSLNDYADDESASDDEGWTRRFSSGKGKWYLMGMPSSVFKPQSYMSKRPRTADGADLERRVSTGSFGVVSTLEADRRGSVSGTPSALTSSDEARGRRRARRRLSKGRPASTRSSSVGSGDEDERQRRRELIRASRPGGTGMVTLPDGTKMKARRVADAETDYDEPDLNEWGFAGLAKEARRSMAVEGAAPACLGDAGLGDMHDGTSAAEEAEGSDTVDGTLKRRRREGSAQSAQMLETGHLVQEPLSLDTDRLTPSSDTIEPPPIVVEKTLSPHLPPAPIASQAVAMAPMGLKLSAEKAAEVRRRHEDEVAALGAEVLANIHKNKAKAAAAAAESAHTRISSNGSDAPRSAAAKQQAQAAQAEQDRPATPKRKPSLSLPLRKPSLPTPARKQSSNTGTVTGPSTPKLGEQRLLEVDEPVTPVAPSKAGGKKELTSSGSTSLSPRMAQQGSPAAGSMRELSPAPSHASRNSRLTSPSESRLHLDPSISIPVPSDRLPRRPDARGYSVVALPGQSLGMRPARPREGRVWQFDDDDEDFEDSETGDESDAGASRSDDEEDEMDQEELEEEERRTAAQKKRATTRAAGQEVMSANKARTAKQSNAAADSFDSLMLAPRGVGNKASPLRTTASSAALPKSKGAGKNVRGTASLTSLGRKSRSSAPKPLTPPEVDEIDDAELWPPSIAQTLGARRPSTAVREEHAVRAKLVRERRQREEKEKEKIKKALKKEADADPDWGWVSARGGGPLAMGAASSIPPATVASTSLDAAAARRSTSRPRAK